MTHVVPRRSSVATAAALALWTASCSPRPAGAPTGETAGGTTSVSPAGGAESDTARIARLEREARALARVAGCSSAGGCRTAPVGHRACGGPRTYVVYCAATTDSAALFRALDALARAEEEYLRQEGMVSTCEFRMPPNVTASGGRCAAATASGP